MTELGLGSEFRVAFSEKPKKQKRLVNKRLLGCHVVRELARVMLRDLYVLCVEKALEKYRTRYIEQQLFTNSAKWINSKLHRPPPVKHDKRSDKSYVVFQHNMSGREEIVAMGERASYTDLYAMARKVFDVSKLQSVRLFHAVPWVLGLEEDALPFRSDWTCNREFGRTLKVHVLR